MLLKYAYSADASTVPDKELTVYALEDSSEIRQAISAFQKEHADIYVNLKIGRSGDNAVTADDALNPEFRYHGGRGAGCDHSGRHAGGQLH